MGLPADGLSAGGGGGGLYVGKKKQRSGTTDIIRLSEKTST